MSIRFYEMIGLWIFLDHPFFPYLDERVVCTCRVYTCRVCTCARCVRMYTCTYIYTYILTRLSKVSRLLRFFLFPMFRICRQSREKKVSIENSIDLSSRDIIQRYHSNDLVTYLVEKWKTVFTVSLLFYYFFLLLLLLSLFFYYYCYYLSRGKREG